MKNTVHSLIQATMSLEESFKEAAQKCDKEDLSNILYDLGADLKHMIDEIINAIDPSIYKTYKLENYESFKEITKMQSSFNENFLLLLKILNTYENSAE